MSRYTGKIKLCVLDTAGVVCDGPQDLRHIYPGDDLKGCRLQSYHSTKCYVSME